MWACGGEDRAAESTQKLEHVGGGGWCCCVGIPSFFESQQELGKWGVKNCVVTGISSFSSLLFGCVNMFDLILVSYKVNSKVDEYGFYVYVSRFIYLFIINPSVESLILKNNTQN